MRLFFITLTCFSLNLHASTDLDNALSLSALFNEIYEKTSPAVVFIEVESTQNQEDLPAFPMHPEDSFEENDFLDKFFKMPPFKPSPTRPRTQKSQGSGFLITNQGHIATNNHVIRDASNITIKLKDGTKHTAEVIGTDPDSDLALLKIEPVSIEPLKFGNSDTLRVGEFVLAIGAPFQLAGTLTHGVISAKQRNSLGITSYEDFIQTDASVNPGNSGGVLINLKGEVIGINTAIYSRTGANNGISFAIPSKMATYVLIDQLKKTGQVDRSYFGVMMKPVDPIIKKSFDLSSLEGALVVQVIKDSPAEKAGIKCGDIILKYDGKAIEPDNLGSFRNAISMQRPKTELNLKIQRGKQQKDLKVTLGSVLEYKKSFDGVLGQLGFQIKNSSIEDTTQASGALVYQVNCDSPAAQANLTPGMVIIEINGHPIPNVDTCNAVLNNESKKTLLFKVLYHGQKKTLILRK